VLNTLPNTEGVRSCIPHLKGEEIFRSTKRKLDVPLSNCGDSYRPDKANFSQPRIQTRSIIAYVDSLGGKGKQLEVNTSPHVTVAFESDCDTRKWHIARINTNQMQDAICNSEGQISGALQKCQKEGKEPLLPRIAVGRKITGVNNRW